MVTLKFEMIKHGIIVVIIVERFEYILVDLGLLVA